MQCIILYYLEVGEQREVDADREPECRDLSVLGELEHDGRKRALQPRVAPARAARALLPVGGSKGGGPDAAQHALH